MSGHIKNQHLEQIGFFLKRLTDSIFFGYTRIFISLTKVAFRRTKNMSCSSTTFIFGEEPNVQGEGFLDITAILTRFGKGRGVSGQIH